MSKYVKIIHGALDQVNLNGSDLLVLRGVVDNDSLPLLLVDDYQREVLPQSKIVDLVKAMQTGTVPDIELGMRGGNFEEREECFYLKDGIYIVDGLQRVTAGKLCMQMLGQGKTTNPPRIGATIFFNSTREWEQNRFRILNSLRTKLSGNILIRNLRDEYPVIDTLIRLFDDKSFVMGGRVCWVQNMGREHLLSASTAIKTVGWLHSHIGPGRSSHPSELTRGLQKIMDICGRNTFRDNIKTFFDVIEQAWGIRVITFKGGAPYMHMSFLIALAEFFSNHTNFWRENHLVVPPEIIKKLKIFNTQDPGVRTLSASGGNARKILFSLITDHVNSGKRTKRLVSRQFNGSTSDEEGESDQ
jgi:hypothetical protein